MKIYIAELSYGTPLLSEVEAVEKEKTFLADRRTAKSLLHRSHYIGKLYKKNGDGVFTNKRDALVYLKDRLDIYIERKEEKLAEAKEERDAIAGALEKAGSK